MYRSMASRGSAVNVQNGVDKTIYIYILPRRFLNVMGHNGPPDTCVSVYIYSLPCLLLNMLYIVGHNGPPDTRHMC